MTNAEAVKVNIESVPDDIREILQRYVADVLNTYNKHIRKIILFGSYARGDFGSDSDLDIMVLVDYPREMIGDVRGKMSVITYKLGYDTDVEINPLMQNEDFFTKWIHSYPFYNSVANEGVELYVA